MNEKELYDVLGRTWSPARIEALDLVLKHGPLTLQQIGELRNIKARYLTEGIAAMFKDGLIGFDPPPPQLKREDITLSSYLMRKKVLKETLIFSKISIDEFNAFKHYSEDIRTRQKEERRLASIKYELRRQFSSIIKKFNEEQLRQALKHVHELNSKLKEAEK